MHVCDDGPFEGVVGGKPVVFRWHCLFIEKERTSSERKHTLTFSAVL